MTSLVVTFKANDSRHVGCKVEIIKNLDYTVEEEECAHRLSEFVNKTLQDAAQRTSFREDKVEMPQVVLMPGELF